MLLKVKAEDNNWNWAGQEAITFYHTGQSLLPPYTLTKPGGFLKEVRLAASPMAPCLMHLIPVNRSEALVRVRVWRERILLKTWLTA